MNDTSTLKILGEDNDFVYLDIPKVFGVLKLRLLFLKLQQILCLKRIYRTSLEGPTLGPTREVL